MASATRESEPIAPTEGERQAIARIAELVTGAGTDGLVLVGRDGATAPLPHTVVRTLRQAVAALARDQAVSVLSTQRLLTTQQAADLLNVSRPYLIRLLDGGTIPCARVGTHRRVRLDDLLAYKRRRDDDREAALDQLTQLNQELGLYDRDRLSQAYPLPIDDAAHDRRDDDGDTGGGAAAVGNG